MPALLSLLGTLLPYLIGAIGIFAAYFGIKHKGVTEERERQQVAQQKQKEIVQQKIAAVEKQDAVVDQSTAVKIQKVEDAKPEAKSPDGYHPGDTFKF